MRLSFRGLNDRQRRVMMCEVQRWSNRCGWMNCLSWRLIVRLQVHVGSFWVVADCEDMFSGNRLGENDPVYSETEMNAEHTALKGLLHILRNQYTFYFQCNASFSPTEADKWIGTWLNSKTAAAQAGTYGWFRGSMLCKRPCTFHLRQL